MTLRRLLVAMDDSASSRAAVEYACHLARLHKARLTGVAVVDLPDIERSIGPVPLGATYYAAELDRTRIAAANEQAKGLLADFVTLCRRRRIEARALRKEGLPVTAVAEEAPYHDLVIVGQRTRFRYGVMEESSDTLERLVKGGVRPTLAVSDAFRPIERFLIAYDGGIQAAKAVQQFLQSGLWKNADGTVLTVGTDRAKGRRLQAKLAEYLDSYGAECRKILRAGDPAEVILVTAAKTRADLLVVGAYGRDNLLSFVFGDVTRTLLDRARRPLFLYH